MPVTVKTINKKHWSKKDTQLLVLALPASVWYIIFCYMPMFGVVIAFKQFRISGGFIKSVITSTWAGLRNFYFLFSNDAVWMIIRNTLVYNAVMIICNILFPVILAIMISELWSKRAAKIYQTIIFFPYFLSWVVVSTLVWAFLSYDMGMINRILDVLGLPGRRWYLEPSFWPPFLIFMGQWKYIGYNMVIFLAAITSLDKTVYEAAVIDGANRSQRILHVTIPCMVPTIVLMATLSLGSVLNAGFDQVFNMYNTLVYKSIDIIDTYVYRIGPINLQYGLSAAV